jgi:Mce-associated membrane protein
MGAARPNATLAQYESANRPALRGGPIPPTLNVYDLIVRRPSLPQSRSKHSHDIGDAEAEVAQANLASASPDRATKSDQRRHWRGRFTAPGGVPSDRKASKVNHHVDGPSRSNDDCQKTASDVREGPAADCDSSFSSADRQDSTPADRDASNARASRWRTLRMPVRSWIATLALIGAISLTATCLWLLTQHREVEARRALAAEYVAAARQGVVTLMSLDYNHAEDDMQRILANLTGDFKQDVERSQNDFVTVSKESKIVTQATANAAAIESMTDDSAVVLVGVTSHVTNSAGAKAEPRSWRLAATVVRDDGQLKISKVEFIP